MAGYAWIACSLTGLMPEDFTPCLFRNVTGLACPSCGTTRSLLLLIQGEWLQALMVNPLGYLALGGLIVIPLMLITDAVRQSNILYRSYLKTESIVRYKMVYVPVILLIAINWGWNIFKGL